MTVRISKAFLIVVVAKVCLAICVVTVLFLVALLAFTFGKVVLLMYFRPQGVLGTGQIQHRGGGGGEDVKHCAVAHFCTPGVVSHGHSQFRGGGGGERVDLANGVVDVDNERPIAVDSDLKLQDLVDLSSRLGQTLMSGDIDGVQYTAAQTNGNGACGLHSLFGSCVDGELHAGDDVRNLVHSRLLPDFSAAMARLPWQGQNVVRNTMSQLWVDAKLVAAMKTAGTDEPQRERRGSGKRFLQTYRGISVILPS